jgi:hypothetical protein
LEKKMKYLKSSLYLLALAWVVGAFIPGSALAQDGTLPPCCHGRVDIMLVPFGHIAALQSEVYSLETADDSMNSENSDPTAAYFNDSTMASSTRSGNSAELPAGDASRKPAPKLKSGDTGRTQRSGHANIR